MRRLSLLSPQFLTSQNPHNLPVKIGVSCEWLSETDNPNTSWTRNVKPTVNCQTWWHFIITNTTCSGPGSSVGIAIDYRLDGPGIESRWGRDFSHTSRPALGPTQPPVQWIPGLSRGVKRPGRGADHPPLLTPRSRKSRAIPLLPSGPLVGCIGWPLPLPSLTQLLAFTGYSVCYDEEDIFVPAFVYKERQISIQAFCDEINH
jgi:hypothetical protein